MGKLRIMTGNAIKKSNRDHVIKYTKRIDENMLKHHLKLAGGFEDPRANPRIKALAKELNALNKSINGWNNERKIAVFTNKKVIIKDLQSKRLVIQDEINRLLQETIINNIEKAFGKKGFVNTNITQGQLNQIRLQQKNLLTKLYRLGTVERNRAIKDTTMMLNKLVNEYIAKRTDLEDNRTKKILVKKIISKFDLIEFKYLAKK